MREFGQLTYYPKEGYWIYTPLKQLTREITSLPYKIQGRDGYYMAWAAEYRTQSRDLGGMVEYIQNNV